MVATRHLGPFNKIYSSASHCTATFQVFNSRMWLPHWTVLVYIVSTLRMVALLTLLSYCPLQTSPPPVKNDKSQPTLKHSR